MRKLKHDNSYNPLKVPSMTCVMQWLLVQQPRTKQHEGRKGRKENEKQEAHEQEGTDHSKLKGEGK
jgi:hypothetical protein